MEGQLVEQEDNVHQEAIQVFSNSLGVQQNAVRNSNRLMIVINHQLTMEQQSNLCKRQ